jgi:F-box protein 21
MPLDTLPDDVVHQLLYYVPPDDTLHAFQLTCRRFARLSNEPLLWRFHCRNFKYWNSAHEISTKFRAPAAGVDWKLLFIRRSADNLKASRLFEEILTTTHRRWHRFEQVARLGYDAKEFLLKQCNAGAHLEDVLSRRFDPFVESP